MSVLVEGRPCRRTMPTATPSGTASSARTTLARWTSRCGAAGFRAPRGRAGGRRQRDDGTALLAARQSARPARALREEADAPWFSVIGVAADVHVRGARGESRSEVYLPYWQFPEPGVNIVLKTREPAGRSPSRCARRCASSIPTSRWRASRRCRRSSRTRSTAAILRDARRPCSRPRALALAAVGIYGADVVHRRAADGRNRRPDGARRGTARDRSRWSIGDRLKLTALGVLAGVAAAAGVEPEPRVAALRRHAPDVLTFAAIDRHARRRLALASPVAGAPGGAGRSYGGAAFGMRTHRARPV